MHFLFLSYAKTSRKRPMKQQKVEKYIIEKPNNIETETIQAGRNQQMDYKTKKNTPELINSTLENHLIDVTVTTYWNN